MMRNFFFTVLSMARPAVSLVTHWKQNREVGNWGKARNLLPQPGVLKYGRTISLDPLTWWISQSLLAAMAGRLQVLLHEEIVDIRRSFHTCP